MVDDASGPNKVRKYLWSRSFLPTSTLQCVICSGAAAGRGRLFSLQNVAPNPHQVLNVQVTTEDFITPEELDQKVGGHSGWWPSLISYAGRASDMKGPFDWLRAISKLREAGIELKATWSATAICLRKWIICQ